MHRYGAAAPILGELCCAEDRGKESVDESQTRASKQHWIGGAVCLVASVFIASAAAATPEPGQMAVSLLGIGLLLLIDRRRQRSQAR